MLKVIIKSIDNRYVLGHSEWKWLMTHLNRPLGLFSITFDEETGEPMYITIRSDNAYIDVITLFIKDNGVKYEFVGELTMGNSL